MEKQQPSRKLHQYILFWLGLIVVTGLVVFVGYALTTQDEEQPQVNVLPSSPTPVLTAEPSITPTPDIEAVAESLSPTRRTATPDPALQATLPPLQDRQFDLGIQIQETEPTALQGYLEAAAIQLKLNWVKADVRWREIESEAGVYQWGNWDTFFSAAAQQGLKVLVTVQDSPGWARPAGGDPALQSPPVDNAQFAAFVTALLRRYPNQIHAVEIWSGMNMRQNWDSPNGINGADYVRMAQGVASAVRSIDPNIIVISGGLNPTGLNDGFEVVDNFTYMDMLLAAGLLDVIDCVGVHHNGYNIAPDIPWDTVPIDASAHYRGPFESPHPSFSFYSTMTSYANKIAVMGVEKPLCVTEFGWAVAADLDGYPPGFEFALDNTLNEQGEWIAAAIEQMQGWDFVWLAFIWNLNYAPEAAFNPFSPGVIYSLIRPGYTLSPAWLAIAEMDFRLLPH